LAAPASVEQIGDHRDVLTGSGLRHGLRVGGLAEEATDEIVIAPSWIRSGGVGDIAADQHQRQPAGGQRGGQLPAVLPASLLASALWSPPAVEGAGMAVGLLLAEGSLLADG